MRALNILIIVLLFTGCDLQSKVSEDKDSLLLPIPERLVDTSSPYFVTGWYYVKDSSIGVPKLHSKNYQTYIDSLPLLDFRFFDSIWLDKPQAKVTSIIFQFNEIGTEKWRIGTKKATRDSICFVVNNVILGTYLVNSEITGGMSIFNGDDDILIIKALIDDNMKKK